MNSVELADRGVDFAPDTAPLFTEAAFSDALAQNYRTEEWRDFVIKISEASSEERLAMLNQTIGLVGNPQVDQDTRDLGLIICGKILQNSEAEILTGTIDRSSVVTNYCQAIEKLTIHDSDLGAPFSLFELGALLSKSLGNAASFDEALELRGKVVSAWSRYDHSFDNSIARHPDWLEDAYAVARQFTPYEAAANQANPHWEWARSAPELSEGQQKLHDGYLEEVRRRRSFKPYLFDHTAGFQQKAAEAGIDMAGYWNLSSPDEAIKIVSNVDLLPADVTLKFNAALSQYGLSTEDLQRQPELAGVMSDQIVGALNAIYLEKQSQLVQPDELLRRLIDQAELASSADRPGRLIKPIRKLLESYDLIEQGADWQAVCSALYDRHVQSHLLGVYRSKNLSATAALNQIKQLLPAFNYQNLVMAGREEDDMYAADWTRDCTAYHLTNGFNAWTLPSWLCNPGLNMMYAVDNGQFVAKFTTLLAIDENGAPRLVIDSVETSKYITDDRRALLSIQRSMQEMQHWADRLGLGDIILCTYSNSTELRENLPSINNPVLPAGLEALGGTTGLSEIRVALTGEAAETEGIYLQSERSTDPGDEQEQPDYRTEEWLGQLESMITEAADNLKPANQEKYFRIARKGNWAKFLNAYLIAAAPRLRKTFDLDHETITDAYNHGAGEYLRSNLDATQRPGTENKGGAINIFQGQFEDTLTLYAKIIKEEEENAAKDEIAFGESGDENDDQFTSESAVYSQYVEDTVEEDDAAVVLANGLTMGQVLGGLKNISYVTSRRGRELMTQEALRLGRLLTYAEALKTIGISENEALKRIFGATEEAEEAEAVEESIDPSRLLLSEHYPIIDRKFLNDLFGAINQA